MGGVEGKVEEEPEVVEEEEEKEDEEEDEEVEELRLSSTRDDFRGCEEGKATSGYCPYLFEIAKNKRTNRVCWS